MNWSTRTAGTINAATASVFTVQPTAARRSAAQRSIVIIGFNVEGPDRRSAFDRHVYPTSDRHRCFGPKPAPGPGPGPAANGRPGPADNRVRHGRPTVAPVVRRSSDGRHPACLLRRQGSRELTAQYNRWEQIKWLVETFGTRA